ncbi:MAG: ATP-binding cassette domain-containing protein [Coriobacteriaceae bacterium]
MGTAGRYLDAPQRGGGHPLLSLSVHEGDRRRGGRLGLRQDASGRRGAGPVRSTRSCARRIWFDGRPMDAAALAAERGRGIALVPNRWQARSAHAGGAPSGRHAAGRGAARRADAARRRARRAELFARYGLAEEVARLYPHELSGGMARRVLLCCALMDAPKLIIADEPTPGLDLSLAQAALADFRAFADAGGGVMLITHDIELALTVADRVAVFRDGTVVEETSVAAFASPDTLGHPFTRQLWHALPEHGFVVPTEGGPLC